MKKRIFKTLGIVLCCGIMTMTVIASDKSYSSTYDMTGGVFSKYIKPKSYIKVNVVPKVGTEGCDMGVVLAQKNYLVGTEK